MVQNDELRQRELCAQYGAAFVAANAGDKLGIALNVRTGLLPINGLRHSPMAGMSGWYIWAGETLSSADDFFQPLHVAHIKEWCPDAEQFLGLAPGWRFLVAGDYVDVWFDPTLLKLT